MTPIVPLARLVEALEMVSPENQAFLNVETGEAIPISDETLRQLEGDDPANAPDWERAMLADLRVTWDQLIPLPTSFEIHEWRIMERFALEAPLKSRDELLSALHRRGAFRAFKDAVHRWKLQDAWYEFLRNALAKIALEWAAEHGIQVAPGPELPLPPDP